MNTEEYRRIPSELFHWITFLTKALPIRSIPTFLELLIGAMFTTTGFVTEAILFINPQKNWTTYYKWIEAGKWSWLSLVRQFVRLVIMLRTDQVFHLAIDDTLTLRASKKAPASQIHHQHGNKPNLANYVRGQCWVSIAAVFKRNVLETVAIPLLFRLMPNSGNTGKLTAANVLIQTLSTLFKGRRVRILVDSWFMRFTLIEHVLQLKFHVIGQARIDTRLYDSPPPKQPGQRGRPKKYGDKYSANRIAHLKRHRVTLNIYGKQQVVRYRQRIVMARFLQGYKVHAVWCEHLTDKGVWTKARLILSTDISLEATEIIESYALRWSIESMFNQTKELWGLKQAWQQHRQTLSRWVHLVAIGYGLQQLLILVLGERAQEYCLNVGWREKDPITAGRLRTGLTRQFMHVNVLSFWNSKCKKFEHPNILEKSGFG